MCLFPLVLLSSVWILLQSFYSEGLHKTTPHSVISSQPIDSLRPSLYQMPQEHFLLSSATLCLKAIITRMSVLISPGPGSVPTIQRGCFPCLSSWIPLLMLSVQPHLHPGLQQAHASMGLTFKPALSSEIQV